MEDITKVISVHKKLKRDRPLKRGYTRVMAAFKGGITRHVDIPNELVTLMK